MADVFVSCARFECDMAVTIAGFLDGEAIAGWIAPRGMPPAIGPRGE